MEAQDIGFIIASISALICSIIYALKHVRKSECCGSRCVQDTGDPTTPSSLTSTIV